MKRSELKQLIREVIQEIRNDTHMVGSLGDDELDPYSADQDFDTEVDIQTPARDEISNVPVHVYVFETGERPKLKVIAKQDISHNNKVIFRKGEDISDYISVQSSDEIIDSTR